MKPLPLEGKTVVNTRPGHQSKSFSEKLSKLGAKVLALPAITLVPNFRDYDFVAAMHQLSSFDFVLFTSVNGVDAVLHMLAKEGISREVLFERKIAAIGPATKAVLLDSGAVDVIMPDSFVSEAVVPCLGELKGKRVLLPRADIARKDLVRLLEQAGAEVIQVAVYRIVSNEDQSVIEKIQSYDLGFYPDILTFTSSSTVRGFFDLVRSAGREDWFHKSELVAIGPITGRTIEELGFVPTKTASNYTTDGIIDVLREGVNT